MQVLAMKCNVSYLVLRYTKDMYLAMIPIVLPLLLLISYGLLAADLVREVTEQRHQGLKVCNPYLIKPRL